MRVFGLIVSLLLLPLKAMGAITPEQLRQMAYDGDIHGAEAALYAAHQETLDGTLEYNELRDIVKILIVSHPDIIAFVEDWRAEYPGSPYADTLWVFQTQQAAWAIRTQAVASKVHPLALQTFNRMQREGMAVALRAYEAAPDYILASDAVFTHNLTTKRLNPSKHLQVLTDVMNVTPSRASLARASLLTQADWGGPGYGAIVRLCNMFAGQVTDIPNYTPDVCAIDLIHYYPSNRDDGRQFSYELMEEVDHPQLAKARARRALDLRSEEDRGDVIAYLSRPDVLDRSFMRMFERRFGPNDPGLGRWDPEGAAFLNLYEQQLKAFVDEGLLHDPFNTDVTFQAHMLYPELDLDPVTQTYSLYSSEKAAFHYLLMRRAVAASPYNGFAWQNLANNIPDRYPFGGTLKDDAILYDAPQINAIYYSNHDRDTVADFLQEKMNVHRSLHRLEEKGEPNPLTRTEELQHVLCPIVRLYRLDEALCETRGGCDIMFMHVQERAKETVDDITRRGLCRAERNAPLQSLLYTEPVPFDLGDLNDGIANR